MAKESDSPKRTEIARLATRQDRSAPPLVQGIIASRTVMGMVVAQLYHDYLEVPEHITVYSDEGGISAANTPPQYVRNVAATVVMTPEVARDIGRQLVGFVDEIESQEVEE